MKRNVPFAVLTLCLVLFGAFPSLADEAIREKATSDPLDPWLDAGWVQVSSGVLTRDLGSGKVEILGFGAEGLRYRLREMRKHLRHLKATYDQYPTPELEGSIRAYRMEIRRILERLETARAADEIEATTKADSIDCANYGVHVNAFALVGSAQGVGASAVAYFDSDCGQQGEVWSHAYGKARRADNSLATVTKTDPLSGVYSGTNVRAAGSISVNGVTSCYSYAYASVTSYDLEVVYTQEDENWTCQAPGPIHPMTGVWSGTVAGYPSELTIEESGGAFSALLSMGANQPVEQVEIRSLSETALTLYRPGDDAILQMTRTFSGSQVCLTGQYLEDGIGRPISLCKDHPMIGVWSGTVAGYASELTIGRSGSAWSALLSMDQANQPVEQVEVRSLSETKLTLYRPGDDAILQMTRTRWGSQECLIGEYLEDGNSRPISLCKTP